MSEQVGARRTGVKVLFLISHDLPDAQSSGWKETVWWGPQKIVNLTTAIISYIDCLLTGSYFNTSVSIFPHQHEMPHIYTQKDSYVLHKLHAISTENLLYSIGTWDETLILFIEKNLHSTLFKLCFLTYFYELLNETKSLRVLEMISF